MLQLHGTPFGLFFKLGAHAVPQFSIADYEAACTLALGTGSAVKSLAGIAMWFLKNRLTKREKEFLGSCANQNVIQLVETEGQPLVIAINGGIIDHSDHRKQTEYLEAFMGLCKRGYFAASGDGMFRLTVAGFKRAARLASQRWRAEFT